jgi:hypothetical protein
MGDDGETQVCILSSLPYSLVRMTRLEGRVRVCDWGEGWGQGKEGIPKGDRRANMPANLLTHVVFSQTSSQMMPFDMDDDTKVVEILILPQN